MPFKPQYDAIASMRKYMRSNSGPDVSDRSYLRRSAQPCCVSGSITRTSACGFSAMLRRLLLKNWNDSATCSASTYSTWLRKAAFGVPSFADVNSIAGMIPWKHDASFSRPRLT